MTNILYIFPDYIALNKSKCELYIIVGKTFSTAYTVLIHCRSITFPARTIDSYIQEKW